MDDNVDYAILCQEVLDCCEDLERRRDYFLDELVDWKRRFANYLVQYSTYRERDPDFQHVSS
jgi:hypothetical protein